MTRAPERGAALLAVLWFVAAVSALAIGFSRFATADRALIVSQVEAVRARALAREGLARTVLVVNERAGRPLPRSLRWRLDEAEITARIERETAKIDLNAADRTLLAALARAVGLPREEAEAIGDAIVDWRDEDELRQPNGAEARDYGTADREHGPANTPFRQIEELRYVLPVDNAAYALMAPHLTLYTGEGEPDRQIAGPVVRAALDLQRGLKPQQPPEEGAGSGRIEGVQPRGGAAEGMAAPAGPTGTPQPEAEAGGEVTSGEGGSVYTVRLDVRLAGGYESHARAVVALASGDDDRVLRILDWTPALPAPAEP